MCDAASWQNQYRGLFNLAPERPSTLNWSVQVVLPPSDLARLDGSIFHLNVSRNMECSLFWIRTVSCGGKLLANWNLSWRRAAELRLVSATETA